MTTHSGLLSSEPRAFAAPAAHHRIESLTIQDGNHFAAVQLDFVDGLNCIIGGLGSGKTTVLQTLRFALGLDATDPRAQANEAKVRGTLGRGLGTARVRTKHGKGYVSERRAGAPARVATESGEHAPVSLDGELFRIDFYAQNEIFGMAEDKAAQLALLDKFAEPEIRALTDEIAQLDRRLDQNAAVLARLQEDIESGAERTTELPSILAALQALTDGAGPDASEARHAHAGKVLRGKEKALLRALREDQRAVTAAADAFEAEARRRLDRALPPEFAASPNVAALLRAHGPAVAVVMAVRDAMNAVRRALALAESELGLASQGLDAAHATQDAGYEEVVRRHEVDAGRAADRERLQGRMLDLEAIQKRLDEQRREHAARTAERKAFQARRAEVIFSRFALRLRLAQEITEALKGRLRVEVVADGDWAEYLALVQALVKGHNIRTPELLEAIAKNIRPDDLAALVRTNNTGPVQALDEAKTNKAERAQRIFEALRRSGRVSELETVALGDVVAIHLRVQEEDIPVEELSTGQMCTAILPILLLQSAAPLIIDQPEDQLDNAFIFDTLVKTLQVVKKSRQIIFVTHNPNILVLGGTDRVFVLEGTSRKGRLKEAGTIDEARDSIEQTVEGGREAFLLRSKRYGH
ncbi:MAG TPA: AAA family ATPase [Polyangiaceae bacterium]|jgi:ABC-type lipoprotein export system ATPase subunit